MRPNILFIVADDLGYADLGCYGGRDATVSPHLDALAAAGMRYVNGYSNSPVCSPTRYALMTGRYQYWIRGASEEPMAGPARGMDWIRGGAPDLKPEHIRAACDASLQRLRTDVIDLYQIHWPNRNAPAFGNLYFDPGKDQPQTSIDAQLQALGDLVQAGTVRTIGLSNETPWGLMSFLHRAEALGLPRMVSVQNPYALVNRVVDNGLDEVMHREGVSLLAYSPLGFGSLTGKYDAAGADPAQPGLGRLARFERMRQQRWARPETLAAAREYNALARRHGLTPTQLALAFCYRNWRVASTIIGVTTLAQLDEDLDAWPVALSAELLAEIDAIRWRLRDPAQ